MMRVGKTVLVAIVALGTMAAALVAAEPAGLSPAQALAQLLEGNQRFAQGTPRSPRRSVERRLEVAHHQAPFAAVLCCADSRVAPELIFDQGLGDLFVVRVAGNIEQEDLAASVKYAVHHLHARLVVVVGHQRCGAVTAALDDNEAPYYVEHVVRSIRQVVRDSRGQPGDPLVNAVYANIRSVVRRLKERPLIHMLAKAGKVRVVGAYYDMDSGLVDLVDEGEPHARAVREDQ
ncbi:MAG: carbonic anhydrase [Candidatus Wallbacteria bacterium]|nr:carbonic anhydrase [Candidatus Wallbacteria bacterium]